MQGEPLKPICELSHFPRMLANLQGHSMWGCYSCSINVKQHAQIYGVVNPKKLLLLGLPASPKLLAFFLNNSNKTAHYYQVWFKYLAEKSKMIFKLVPVRVTMAMMKNYFMVILNYGRG